MLSAVSHTIRDNVSVTNQFSESETWVVTTSWKSSDMFLTWTRLMAGILMKRLLFPKQDYQQEH